MDQPKIERLLRLMKMLTGNVTYTVEEISEKLNISLRTVYRYIDTFRTAGFVIKSNGSVYKLDKSSPYFKDISQLIHFTDEEAYILKSAIESIDETNLLKQNLKRKLYTIYNYKILAETITKGKHADNVNKIVDAIENQKQIVLQNYSSAHSNKVSSRIVEAYAFTTNYIQIWAYEVETCKNKLFKVARIEDIEILPSEWQYKSKHKAGYIDIFRISSFNLYNVKLKLGVRAAMLLIEEYPLAERDIKKTGNNEWLLNTNVCSYEGIGRFVLGLPDDVQIVDSPEFENFVKEKIKFYLK